MIANSCALCDLEVSNTPVRDGEHQFCCMGCRAVFQILSARNALENYQEDPLFLQSLQAGIISNPLLIDQIKQKQRMDGRQWEKVHLEIGEMWCSACAEVIKWLLLRQKGIKSCVIDYSTDLAAVEYYLCDTSKEEILSHIRSMGYRAEPLHEAQKRAVTFGFYLRFVVAVFCAFNMMMFAYPIYASYFEADMQGYASLFSWLSLVAALPLLTYCAWPIIRRFGLSVKARMFGMETLVVLSVFAAFALSVYELLKGTHNIYFDSMAVIIVFVLLGKMMEARAKFSAKEAVLRLHLSMPRRGRKQMEDGTIRFVPIKEVAKGDLLVAFAGEKLVVDGTVIEGRGSCDESLITGESFPVVKEPGSALLGGSILQQGPLTYRVTHTIEEGVLSRMIAMVEKEVGYKTAYVRAADTIARWFVPVIVVLAFLTTLFCLTSGYGIADAAWRGVAVLLISCPCAIGIAAPLAEAHLMNRLAQLGVIVRNRGCLSLLGKETVYLFDKTGTVTEGEFRLLAGLEGLSLEHKQILKGLVSRSLHPISRAIDKAINLIPTPLERVEEVVGMGVVGFIGSTSFCVGSEAMMRQADISVEGPDGHEAIVSSAYFAEGNHCLARLELGDRVRNGVGEVMQQLGSDKVWIVSGDAEATVAAVARQVGCHQYRACCGPAQKREIVEQLRQKGHVVCMFGDGINDALALTAAHVGISVVTATDISVQVSDLLLTTEKLQVIPQVYAMAAKTRRIVRQNLFWAFFYNVIGVGLAMCGFLTPIFAAFAMVVSSVIVLLNACRIR